MRQKLDVGTLMLGTGAILVLIALFLDWYRPGGTAWDVFEITDVLLAAMALAAIILAARRLSAGESGTPGWIQGLAVATLVVVAAQLIQPPPGLRGAERQTGAWLALAGSVVMVAGAILHLARISISVDVAERDRRRRVAAVDRRRPPAAAPPAAEEPTTRAAGRFGPVAGDPDDDPTQRTQELRAITEDEPRP
jgi:hypothetical protein